MSFSKPANSRWYAREDSFNQCYSHMHTYQSFSLSLSVRLSPTPPQTNSLGASIFSAHWYSIERVVSVKVVRIYSAISVNSAVKYWALKYVWKVIVWAVHICISWVNWCNYGKFVARLLTQGTCARTVNAWCSSMHTHTLGAIQICSGFAWVVAGETEQCLPYKPLYAPLSVVKTVTDMIKWH